MHCCAKAKHSLFALLTPKVLNQTARNMVASLLL